MKIAVLLKEVPDTYGERKLDPETGLADRGATDAVLDEIGERALEVALTYADNAAGTDVTVLSMGPESVVATLRKALSMGANSAVHVLDDGLVGADLTLTAEVLSAAVRRGGFDLVITGNLSTDGTGGVLPAMMAEHLNLAQLSGLSAVNITELSVCGERATDSGLARVEAVLPAVVSVTEALPAGRFPNFRGIMAAKKKPLETLSLTDLGVDAADETVGRSIVIAGAERPARVADVKIVDDGDAAGQLVDFLASNRLA